jgi:hypothetical protein
MKSLQILSDEEMSEVMGGYSSGSSITMTKRSRMDHSRFPKQKNVGKQSNTGPTLGLSSGRVKATVQSTSTNRVNYHTSDSYKGSGSVRG